MPASVLISNDRQAREIEGDVAALDQALSSDQTLRAIVEGLPREVIDGVRRSLATERRELTEFLRAYRSAKDGDFDLFKEHVGNDPGAFLVATRIIRGLSQKDLARKLGLRALMIQRWEAEKYRSISLANFQKVAQALGVRWQMEEGPPLAEQWGFSYDFGREDLMKVLKHARMNGWLTGNEASDENALATLVRYVGDHVIRYGLQHTEYPPDLVQTVIDEALRVSPELTFRSLIRALVVQPSFRTR